MRGAGRSSRLSGWPTESESNTKAVRVLFLSRVGCDDNRKSALLLVLDSVLKLKHGRLGGLYCPSSHALFLIQCESDLSQRAVLAQVPAYGFPDHHVNLPKPFLAPVDRVLAPSATFTISYSLYQEIELLIQTNKTYYEFQETW